MRVIPSLLILSLNATLLAEIINVPADYSTIQAALNVTQSGDTVLVQPGTYYENIFWPDVNGIKLISAGDTSNTVIDGGANGSVIYMNPSTATIDSTTEVRGFKITNGGNIANGGGTFINNASPVLTRLWITGNTASTNGGGIYLYNANATLKNIGIHNNTSDYGGGLFQKNGTIVIRDVTIKDNEANTRGGGIFIHDSNGDLADIIINGNTAAEGGGIFIGGYLENWPNASVQVENCILKYNSAISFNGGGIGFQGYGDLSINNCTFTSNIAVGGGGALYVAGNDTVAGAIRDCAFLGNSISGSNRSGGAVELWKSKQTFSSCTFINNSASIGAGGEGGAVKLWDNCETLLDSCTFVWNSADYGGAVHLSSGSMQNSGFSYNSAKYGGAILTDSGTPVISKSTIFENHAQNDGDGVYTEGSSTPQIGQSNFRANGIALYNSDNSVTIQAINNWWGDASGPFHQTQNLTGQGDSVNAFVNITPFFTEPDIAAPPIPIQNLATTGTGNDFISLAWDTSPLGDLAGYKVYYDSDSSGFPYANTIDVGTDTSYTLSGLPLGTTFYLAVTCYDTDGNESWYSEEVTAVTRVLEVQNLDIGGDENLQQLVTHTPAVSFDYYDSMGEPQTTYHVQVSTQSDFSSIDVWDTGEVASDATSVIYAGDSLGDGQTYYLRVKVGSGDFWSDWTMLEFRMNSEPPVPVVVAPINNAVVSPPVILKVLNSTDAEGDTLTYSFKAYGDASLSTLLDSVIAVLEGQDITSWQVVAALPDNGQYWWTASANDGYEEGVVSDAVSFLLNTANDAPEVFALLSPQDSAEVATLTPLLDWGGAFDPDPADTVRYSLYLDMPDPGVVVISTDTATSYQVVPPLSDNTTYYWKVVARDLAGATTESTGGYHSFRVNTANDPPSDFALTSPENGSMVTDLTPTFHWEEATDPDGESVAVSYRFYVGSDTSFTGVTPVELDTSSYTPASDLTEDEVYYWKVVAVDDLGGETSSVTWSFWTNNANSPPAEFTLVSPVDGSEIATLSPAFSWHPSSDGDIGDSLVYSLELGASVDSLAVVYTGTDTVCTPSDSLTDNTTYYWKVVARDLAGATTENTGGYYRFRINMANDPPSEFALLSPSDGAMITDLTPIFLWQESIDPDNGQSGMLYRFYLGSDSLLTGVTPVDMDTNSYALSVDLQEDEVYYWKVVAVDDNGGETSSEVWWFLTNSVNSPPEEFALADPANGSEVALLTPIFAWHPSGDTDIGDVVSYRLELGSEVDSLQVVYSGSDTTYTPADSLTDNTTYYWKVVARDLSGATTENTGGYHSFRVNTVNDPPLEFALISPDSGAMMVDLTPEFHWEAATDPDGGSPAFGSKGRGSSRLVENADLATYPVALYRFYLGTDTAFTSVTPVEVETNSYTPAEDLTEDQVYYWKVVAVDSYGGETSSGVWWFWTNSVNSPPEGFVLVAPADDSELTTLIPAFTWQASGDPDIADSLSYDLELGESVDSLAVVYTGEDTTYTPAEPLTDNATYYWKVVARDLSGATTENTGGYHRFISNVENEPPSIVFLVTPSDSSIEITLKPNFYWTEAVDPDPDDMVAYGLYYWQEGINPPDSLMLDTNSVEIASPLEDNSQYLWAVKSYDNHGARSISDTVLFWTDAYPEPPLQFATIWPANDTTGLPTSVEFIWHSTVDPDPLDQIVYILTYATDWSDSLTYARIEGITDTTMSLTLEDNTEYFWLVEAMDKDSLITGSNDNMPVRFVVGNLLGVDAGAGIPEEYALHQNYPNPFNPTSTIQYDLPEATSVRILVYDILGREIVRLLDGYMEPGFHQVVWNGRDGTGRGVTTGIYITHLVTPEYTKSIKMLLLK